MTTGSIVFFSGVGLFVLAILLAIVFMIKKPQYEPEKAAYDGRGNKKTQNLRGTYPSDRTAVRREKLYSHPTKQETLVLDERTELIQDTEIVTGTERIRETATTEAIYNSTERLTAEYAEGAETELI